MSGIACAHMPIPGHIAGVPLEETALSLAPVATVLSAVVLVRLRQRLGSRAVER